MKIKSLLLASSSGWFSFSAVPPIEELEFGVAAPVLFKLAVLGFGISVSRDDRLTGNGSEAVKTKCPHQKSIFTHYLNEIKSI